MFMINFMKDDDLSKFLSCNLSSYKIKDSNDEYLSISISSIDKLKFLLNYFNNYPLFGIKSQYFQDWNEIYTMIVNQEHLTE